MCGILLVVTGAEGIFDVFDREHVGILEAGGSSTTGSSNKDDGEVDEKASLISANAFFLGLSRRGPDGVGEWLREIKRTGDGISEVSIRMGGSLLQLRGVKPSASPLVDVDGNVLCLNGEIFGGLEGLGYGDNDSKALLLALARAGQDIPDGRSAEVPIVQVLSRLRGPWAVVYWQESAKKLWFGRDVIGRRSLLVHRPDAVDSRFILSSLSPIEADTSAEHNNISRDGYSFWDEVGAGIYSFEAKGKDVEKTELNEGRGSESGENIVWHLQRHGWADFVPSALKEFQRDSKLVHSMQNPLRLPVSIRTDADFGVPAHSCFESAVDGFLAALDVSVERRVTHSTRPSLEAEYYGESLVADNGPTADIGVLFSGGVDSMVIAALADRHCPPEQPIDLLNVCFDNGRSPDRAAAVDGVAELRTACPGRVWHLIFVDASLEEVDTVASHLTTILHPSNTVMDLNIGAAIWLAARGKGWLAKVDEDEENMVQRHIHETGLDGREYRSRAKVLLLGQGADEQCAGYGRHRTVFRKGEEKSIGGGWQELSAEIQLDVRRLWIRNLGRDDRLIADHGREARFPFLDEGVMLRLLTLPLNVIADLRLPQGVGDKMLIRAVAERLGLHNAARRVKRAIQFGTRIAQKSNCREFGSGRKANASSAGQVKLNSLKSVEVVLKSTS